MINYKISNLNLLNEYLILYKKCFPGFKKNIEYFRWLYENNPMGNYVGIDAFDGNKLIGQIGGIPYDFKFCFLILILPIPYLSRLRAII